VEDGAGSHGCREVATTAAVVAEYPPILQASEDVLDASPTATLASPGAVPNDLVAPEDGDAEAGDAAVPAVGEDAAMLEAEGFDR
jgi:hypothetical protein